ncbi:PIN domain-containing protein [Butyrivibrio sp. VCB2001]|uniref:PIN domain-containing protein n=1 Tax=Butyrivibrio sp. VCB2001 TaxID=1280667 RepID=UPI000408A4F9|nr:PIN domain-containing protein [Butyrivibrio sp. VCB2001]
MRSAIVEYLEPTNKEKQELWNNAVFVFDTNVLLNLYRYSAKTRNSLLEALATFKDRIWIPYQVAYEYMSERCDVIYETVHRYDQFKKEITSFTENAISTLRMSSNDDEISELNRYLYKWLDSNKDRNLLVTNSEDDEILNKVLDIFEGRVGEKISVDELNKIKEEGEKRYEDSIPPGYKDEKKKSQHSDNNAFGDLVIWKQILKYAKEKKVGIVYVTNDQKEDWWNIVKGRTIGPRIELRKEFMTVTGQCFHMYSMDGFISIYNQQNENQIEKSAINEVINLERSDKKNKKVLKSRSVSLTEKLARTEETIDKIQKRIERRQKIVDDIDNKYNKQGLMLPENIKIQYDNTVAKKNELLEVLDKKNRELEVLRQAMTNDVIK